MSTFSERGAPSQAAEERAASMAPNSPRAAKSGACRRRAVAAAMEYSPMVLRAGPCSPSAANPGERQCALIAEAVPTESAAR